MSGVQIGAPSNFPYGFANGLSVRGMPLVQMQPGQVFFVNNSKVTSFNINQKAGSDGNRGTFLDPFGTLNYAVNTACVQGRGDIVFVGPGHQELIPDAVTLVLACAGVAVVGLGAGTMRPTFTFNTATTANIPVRADSTSVQNCIFLANFANIASMFTGISASVTAAVVAGVAAISSNPGAGGVMSVTVVGSGIVYPGASVMGTGVPTGTIILSQLSGTTGGVGTYQLNTSFTFASGTITTGSKDFAVDACGFRDLSSVLNAISIYTSSGSANGADGLNFTRNTVSSLGTTAATTALVTSVAQDRWRVLDNFGCSAILNDTAAILATGANNMTMFELARNHWERPNTSSSNGSFVSTSATAWTGHAYDNYLYQLDNSAGIWIATGTGGAFGFSNNFSPVTGAVDKSALINPVAV